MLWAASHIQLQLFPARVFFFSSDWPFVLTSPYAGQTATAGMDPIRNATDRHLFVEFFEHLGIEDDANLGFMSSLLRTAFDAVSKLDLHLAPYGAAVHCAVSRMAVPNNPREAPSHRWIRVVDRLGFFADGDDHAERIVNVGLAYAYQQLELDALARASATLRQQMQSTDAGRDDDKLPPGGVEVATTGADKGGLKEGEAGLVDASLVNAEDPLPVGGLVVSAGKDFPRSGDQDGETELPPGGLIVSGTTSGMPAAPATAASSATAATSTTAAAAATASAKAKKGAYVGDGAGDDADPDSGGDAGDDLGTNDASKAAPSHLIFERQPSVLPPAPAVGIVSAVLRTVSAYEDGADMLRTLLSDAILKLARTGAYAKGAMGATGSAANKADNQAIYRTCSAWWPQWNSPTHPVSTSPPPGTVSFKVNPLRLAKTTRWVIVVDMEGVNPTMEEITVKPSRFFNKEDLPAVEHVVRVSGKTPMKLKVVIAALLLVATKEERFIEILSCLAFAGRAVVNKVGPLTSAFRHEFFSDGLTTATPPGSQQAASSSTLQGPGAPASSAAALRSPHAVDLNERYADMDVALKKESVNEATLRRAERMIKNKGKGRRPSLTSGSPTGSVGGATVSAGSAATFGVGAAGRGALVASGVGGGAAVHVVVGPGVSAGESPVPTGGPIPGAPTMPPPVPGMPAVLLGGLSSAASGLAGSAASGAKPPRGVKRTRPSRTLSASTAGQAAASSHSPVAGRGAGRGGGGARGALSRGASNAGGRSSRGRGRGSVPAQGDSPGGAARAAVVGGAAGHGSALVMEALAAAGASVSTVSTSGPSTPSAPVTSGASTVPFSVPTASGAPVARLLELPGADAPNVPSAPSAASPLLPLPIDGRGALFSPDTPAFGGDDVAALPAPRAGGEVDALLADPGGEDAVAALPAAPLTFKERMTAQHARVDSDLNASRASLVALGLSTELFTRPGEDTGTDTTK